MTVLGRYLRREIVGAVLFVLVGFLALFAFFDFIGEVEDVGRGGYKLQHALTFVLLTLPSHAYELMPIAALIGAIYALAQFASHSEFTAMRAAGLGRRAALVQIVRIGLVFAVVTLFLGEVVTPRADQLAQRVRLSALGTSIVNQFRSGLWIKDTSRDENGAVSRTRFVNIATLLPDTTLRDVRVYEFDASFHLRQILVAGGGRFRPPDSWQLENVQRTDFGSKVSADRSLTLRAQMDTLPELIWRSELNPDLLGVLLVEPEKMSAWTLAQYVQHLRENQQQANRYEIALWKKLVYPLAVVVMMALALPFGYLQARAGGIGYKVFAGIMLGIGFHFLNGLFSHLGLLNTWPAWVAASIPSIVAVLLALGMLAWVDRAR
ncbi:MAG TPA: LPS export ABC transporter permease LptG [Burkholderiaceae bacterium]|nr:LPS export ABC transporter permease LptG [Burkholderiaceae bacterium]